MQFFDFFIIAPIAAKCAPVSSEVYLFPIVFLPIQFRRARTVAAIASLLLFFSLAVARDRAQVRAFRKLNPCITTTGPTICRFSVSTLTRSGALEAPGIFKGEPDSF